MGVKHIEYTLELVETMNLQIYESMNLCTYVLFLIFSIVSKMFEVMIIKLNLLNSELISGHG